MECRTQAVATVIPNDPNAIRQMCDRFVEDVDGLGYDTESAMALVTGFAEALANAHTHGNRREPQRTIVVVYRLNQNEASLDVCDEGYGFDPSSVPDPTVDENIGKPGGRGLWLMRALFDTVEFVGGGRRVQLTKRIAKAPLRDTCSLGLKTLNRNRVEAEHQLADAHAVDASCAKRNH